MGEDQYLEVVVREEHFEDISSQGNLCFILMVGRVIYMIHYSE